MTPILSAFAILLIVTLGYIGVCAAAPFAACRRCQGLGFQLRHDRKGHPKRGKNCRRCKATGLRLRIGRRLWNAGHHTYRDGTR